MATDKSQDGALNQSSRPGTHQRELSQLRDFASKINL